MQGCILRPPAPGPLVFSKNKTAGGSLPQPPGLLLEKGPLFSKNKTAGGNLPQPPRHIGTQDVCALGVELACVIGM